MEKGVYMRVELLDVNNNKAAKMMVGMTNSEVKMAPFSMVYDAAMLEKDEGNKYTKKKRLLVEGVGRLVPKFILFLQCFWIFWYSM